MVDLELQVIWDQDLTGQHLDQMENQWVLLWEIHQTQKVVLDQDLKVQWDHHPGAVVADDRDFVAGQLDGCLKVQGGFVWHDVASSYGLAT